MPEEGNAEPVFSDDEAEIVEDKREKLPPAPKSTIGRIKRAVKKTFFPDAGTLQTNSKWQRDEERGKVVAAVKEIEFIGAVHVEFLSIDRHYMVTPEGDEESQMIAAASAVVGILRSNPIQRQLVKAHLFRDSSWTKKSQETRVLAGNIRMYINLALDQENIAFTEVAIEMLAIYLLGATADTSSGNKGLTGSTPAKSVLEPPPQTPVLEAIGNPEILPPQPKLKPHELQYVLKCNVFSLVESVVVHPKIGVDHYLKLNPPSQTLVWALDLCRLFIEEDERAKRYFSARGIIRTAWEVITRKTRRDREAGRLLISALKLSCASILRNVGKETIKDVEGENSINMINLNNRSIKEYTKLIHFHPQAHEPLLHVLTMLCQKQHNNELLKSSGMMQYLVHKVLPFHSEKLRGCLPYVVILLNSWMVYDEDLQFFIKFSGLECLMFHLEAVQAAITSDETKEGVDPDASTAWEDMVLHGVSIIYKLSDYPENHPRMVSANAIPVLLECIPSISPMKSLYHLNSAIAVIYSLRNIASSSVQHKRALATDPRYCVLLQLLSNASLPAQCHIHLLFLLVDLTSDAGPDGEPSEEYRHIVVNRLFEGLFSPMCRVVQATPLNKPLDDSQLTILCLALQILISLVSLAKLENPLLCFQIGNDLPSKLLERLSAKKSVAPFPGLASDLLALVYYAP
eukprot:Sspe_Gene.63550::Locus_36541_Transcript_1_1_Confidence_1.000_Length_2175::g.63550::m.63550